MNPAFWVRLDSDITLTLEVERGRTDLTGKVSHLMSLAHPWRAGPPQRERGSILQEKLRRTSM